MHGIVTHGEIEISCFKFVPEYDKRTVKFFNTFHTLGGDKLGISYNSLLSVGCGTDNCI
jgi:hypothetical protein